MEKFRRCLGCGDYFRSASAANRFCKCCTKKRRRMHGALEPLNTSALPPGLSILLHRRYYENPVKPRHKPPVIIHPEWGPPYPADI